MEAQVKLSDRLDAWLRGDGPKTLDGLIALCGEKSFAILFVILLAYGAFMGARSSCDSAQGHDLSAFEVWPGYD